MIGEKIEQFLCQLLPWLSIESMWDIFFFIAERKRGTVDCGSYFFISVSSMSMQYARKPSQDTRIRQDKKCCVFVGSCIITAPKLDAIEERKRNSIRLPDYCAFVVYNIHKCFDKNGEKSENVHWKNSIESREPAFVTEKQKTKKRTVTWNVSHWTLQSPPVVEFSGDNWYFQR